MTQPVTIWLAGYGLTNKASTLLRRVEALDALVIDVRLYPTSRRWEWREIRLRSLLGTRYTALSVWGNLNWSGELEGEPIQIKDFDAGMSFVEPTSRIYQNLILLCCCRDEVNCHRGYLGKRLREEYGYTVKSLVWKPKPIKEVYKGTFDFEGEEG
jgi:uncharacterized protein (DUF488 family)